MGDDGDPKAVGDALFRAARFDEAVAIYRAAIAEGEGQGGESLPGLLPLLSNLSACFLQLRQYDECIRTCSRILEHDGKNYKALLRRTQCYEMNGELERAMRDVAAVETELGRCPPSLAKKAAELRNRIGTLQRLDAVVLAAQGRPDRLVNESQTLRLQFLHDCPLQLSPEAPTTFNLSIGNEFGLFNRECMLSPCGPAPQVTCEVLVLGLGATAVAPTCTQQASAIVGTDGRASVVVQMRAGDMPSTRFLLKFSLTASLPCGAAVAPIYSLPLVLRTRQGWEEETEMEKTQEGGGGVSASCIRGIAVGEDLTVYGFESPGLLGIGGKLWDSTYVLLEYLQKNQGLLAGRRVAELGAGTGMAGVACACMCPDVSIVVTDFLEVTPLIAANIRLNAGMQALETVVGASLTERCRAQAYAWGTEPMGCDVDVVIASDVVYDPVGYLPLVQSLCSLLAPAGAGKMAILAYRSRHPEEYRFFALLAEHGLELLPQELHRKSEAGQQLEDVKIFHICAR